MIGTLNKTKHCNMCNTTKEVTQFYKKRVAKDGLQIYCKSCFKEINQNFRELKPTYQVNWQRANKTEWLQYMREWQIKNMGKSDDRSKIYTISAPNGKVYVGMTQTAFSKRVSAHRNQFKNNAKFTRLLHDSFTEFGFENHKFDVMDFAGLDRETLRSIERTMIEDYQQKGISLNINK